MADLDVNLDLQHIYQRFRLPPDADQEEIRRAYLQLRHELDGEDLRLLYAAWENLWSPQNRVRVDALRMQTDETAPSVETLLAEIEPTAGTTEWRSFIDREALIRSEAGVITSLILERTWLGHAYDTLFTRDAPTIKPNPRPQPTLTPVTRAVRPVSAEERQAAPERLPQRPWLRNALAGAALVAVALVFLLWGDRLNLRSAMTTAFSTSAPQNVVTFERAEAFDAPSRDYIIATVTPYGRRPLLAAQVLPATPVPAFTAPIRSEAFIERVRKLVEEKTTPVPSPTPGFSIAFNASPTILRPASGVQPTSSSPQPTATATPSPSPTPEPTPTATPADTATPVPVFLQSSNYTNVRS
ncbi:MAG: J domain-containing protein, partial [Myxococcales bacterium]|nr:J domain-containing protein [Myxococcales bacterium]